MAVQGGESGEAPVSPLPHGRPLLAGVVRWMQEGVVLHDADGRVVEATPSACDLLGVAEDRLLGTTPDDVHGEASTWVGWRLVDVDGNPVPVERSPAAVAGAQGSR